MTAATFRAIVAAILPFLHVRHAIAAEGLDWGTTSQAATNLSTWIPIMKLDKVCPQSIEELSNGVKVVVAMTTIPLRINRLEPVLDSMIAQTWPLEAIYLSIPVKYNRTGEVYSIPQWLREKPEISILRCMDLGPGTHLLNALKHVRDPMTYIVLVDDDHIYAKDMVESLMRGALCSSGGAVAAQGFLSYSGIEAPRDGPRYLQDLGMNAGPVLVSYLGVVYQRYFFDEEVYNWRTPQCRYQDDMWFSAHLASKGIPRFVLGSALGVMELNDLHLGPSSLTFWSENKPRKVNHDCNNALLQWKPDLWAWRRRKLLFVCGLPPLDGLPWEDSTSTRRTGEWTKAMFILRHLPLDPDLIVLCAPVSAAEKGEAILGLPRRIDGLLVLGSGICPSDAKKLRLWSVLHAVTEVEADPNTLIVAGTLEHLAEHASMLPAITQRAVDAVEATDGQAQTEYFAWHSEEVVAFTIGGYLLAQKTAAS